MNSSGNYAEVLLPLPLEGSFTYAVPGELKSAIQVGCRVIIPFGSSKQYTGVVVELHDRKPDSYQVKPILSSLDSEPLLKAEHLKFWKWIASYYLCPEGEVMKAALPSVFKPDSEGSGFRMKTQTFVRLTSGYVDSPESLKVALGMLSRAKKQHNLLITYLDMSGFMHDATALKEVSKTELLKDSGASAELLKALCQRSILECYEKDEEPAVLKPTCNHAVLNEQQQKAIDAIRKTFESQQVCLLHGYTSSGKTEIYIHLIEECINSGKQALMLVPEIALTTQLADRLRRVFGDKLGVYHSGLSDYERMCVWSQLTEGNGFQVILGARSSVFLPFRSLGLIVVDEEHETSYKQQDPAPRYNGRNAALVLAAQFGAKTLLGSATPSVESYANCLMGKSGLVELFMRHKEMPLPEIIAVNTRELKRKKRMKSIFSPLLEEKINDALKAGEQVILFQNRRGYSPLLECNVCGWVPRCKHCDVSLTYHKNRRKLCCHYCGFEQEVPSVCPCCGESNPTTRGFGTEQVEEETLRLFPDARIVRMDTDTTRNKHSFEKILHDFESGKTNIMIGTQMVSKGLDFSNVRVVGILNADMMLNLPDFRAHERAYQLMAQVSGRAGRSGQRGQVIIQTSKEDNQIIGHVISNDYKAFFNEEVLLRQSFGYPPYTRIVNILFKHYNPAIVRQAALGFAEIGRSVFGEHLLGPDQPPVSRIKNLYLQSLMLKIDISTSALASKTCLCQIRDKIHEMADFKAVQIVFDVDPI